jgi:predicted PurR-regulated permease PerM
VAAQASGRLTYGFVARATLIVIAVWALARGLWIARNMVFVAFAAVLLAILFSLLVDRLEERIPRWGATVVTFLVFLALVAGFWLVAWPQVESQVSTLAAEVPRVASELADWVQARYQEILPPPPAGEGQPGAAGAGAGGGAGGAAQRAGGGGEGPAALQARLRAEAVNLVSGAVPLLNTVMGTFTALLVILFTALFFVLRPAAYLDAALRLAPVDARPRLRSALVEAAEALKRWIAGMAVSMAVIFVATTAGLYLLGIPAALVLGMVAGLLVFIPFIGPILSAIPAMAMALTVSPITAVWVALLYFGIQQLESNALTPVVMREAVDLQPATTLLFQVVMGVLFGFLGLFLAVPILAAVRVLVERLYVEPLEDGATA